MEKTYYLQLAHIQTDMRWVLEQAIDLRKSSDTIRNSHPSNLKQPI